MTDDRDAGRGGPDGDTWYVLGARARATVAVARTVAQESRRRDLSLLAAAVAYYAFTSLIPLALLGVVAGTALGGSSLAATVTGAFGQFLTPEGERVLEAALTARRGRGGATLLGVVILAWGGLKLFRGVDRAFSQVYGTDAGSLPSQLVDAAVVLVAGSVGVGAAAAGGAAIALLGLPPILDLAGTVVVWLTLSGALFPLYYVFPDVDVSVRDALPGTALAAAALAGLGALFGAYTTVAGNYALYGLLGAVLLLLTWLYLAASAVILGAVVNAVLAGKRD
jgi:membrane protein